jgi:hypothetical protein
MPIMTCARTVFRVLAVGLLMQAAYAEPLKPSPNRSSPQDLEVDRIGPDGSMSSPTYYTYDQLLTLPLVTVKTAKDPNTRGPAEYVGVYISDLFAAFGANPDQTVIVANCYDKYKQYYDADYNAKHKPILLLKFDGQLPDEWPKTIHDTSMGPYCVVHENFESKESIYGYHEKPRIPFGVISLELTSYDRSFGAFAAKKNLDNPEVIKGAKIAIGSCISCHNIDASGGQMADRPWAVLVAFASTNESYFRNYVVNPRQLRADARMPAHPTFDADTLNALVLYLKSF